MRKVSTNFVSRVILFLVIFCVMGLASESRAEDTVSMCHATRSATNPFVLEQISPREAVLHRRGGDVAPINGKCPTSPATSGGEQGPKGNPGDGPKDDPVDQGDGDGGEESSVTLCHVTRSRTNPFVMITVNRSAMPGHIRHGDFVTTGANCPGATSGDTDGGGTDPGGTDGDLPGDVVPTPEPVTMLLFGAGLAGVGYAARRRAKKSK